MLLAEADMASAYKTLARRERELIRLMADGYANAQIAGQLSVRLYTVNSHRTNRMRKLGLSAQDKPVTCALWYDLS